MKINKILVNDLEKALGIDTPNPLFHILWEDGGSDDWCRALSGLKVIVKDEDGNCVWSISGLEYSSAYIYYEGEALLPKSNYQVLVRLLDENGHTFDEGIAYFETGFLGTNWQASWVEPVQEDALEEKALGFFEMVTYVDDGKGSERLRPCQNVRKDFTCPKIIKKARAYATAHGIYNLYMNGQKISERRLAPETSCYEENLYYQTYDVTDVLTDGTNTVAATLADGWWIGRLGMAGDSCNYGNRLAFLMQLEITYTDGTMDRIISDDSMLCKSSFICYSDLFIGEKWDMSKADEDWNRPDFTDTDGWQKCSVIAEKMDNLSGQPIEAVTATKALDAPKVIITPDGSLVLDFGQVLAGVVRLHFKANAGDVLELQHSEVLDEHGNFKCNILGRNKNQRDVCVCTSGEQVFEPQFTYHGFRYVRVRGICREQIIKAQALVIGTPLRKIGSFECSDSRLNQLQHNIEWSEISNMCSVPTDCPQREKIGWTGDIQVFARTGCFNYDLKNFLEGWLDNVRIDQAENGEIPVAVPNTRHQDRIQRMMSGDNSSSVWGDACVLVPCYLFEAYGDVKVLEKNFEMMQGWMKFIDDVCQRRPDNYDQLTEGEKARQPYLFTKCYHFGDWLIPSLRALPSGVAVGTEKTAAVVGSAYYAYVIKYFIRVCEALGKDDLAEEYNRLLPFVKDAVAKTFVAADGTVNGCDLQGLYVIILACEIVDGDLKRKVLDKLVSLIKANDYCLDTGFSSVSYLLDVLYDNGYVDVAYKLLFQTKSPSWLYMVERGATSIWENWAAITPEGIPTDSSYNHYAFGCVGDWIYRHIGGLQKLEPGYKKILFKPDFFCGLEYSKCSVESPYGRVACEWKKTRSGYVVDVVVPQGTTAVLDMEGKMAALNPGKYTFRC